MDRIVLVDNVTDELSELKSILSETYEVLAAYSEDSARCILKENVSNISAIVLNVYLADNAAFSLLSFLKNDIDGINTPIIAVIHQGDSVGAQKVIDMGAADCIDIPFNPPVVLQRLENAIRLYESGTQAAQYYKRMMFASQLVDDSSSAVYVCDANTYDMLYVNKNYAKICGKDICEANGKKCYEFLKDRAEPCTPCFLDSADYGHYTEHEYTNVITGKHYITRGKLINWDGKQALVEYMADETERINANRSLIDMVDNMPAGLGIIHLYPDNRVEIVYLNNGFYDMLGDTRIERRNISGNDFYNAIHPEDRDRVKQDLLNAVKNNTIANTDFRIIKANGQYTWLNTRRKVAYKTDKATVIYTSYTNIDLEKKSHLQLEASKRVLELANKEGNVSVWFYDIDKKLLTHDLLDDTVLGYPEVMENVPESVIDAGLVYSEDIPIFLDAYQRLFSGAERSDCIVRLMNIKTADFERQHIVLSRINDEQNLNHMCFGMTTNVNTQEEHQDINWQQ